MYDKIVCVSKDVEEGFHKLFRMADKTVVVYNVIDDENILRKAEEPLEWEVNSEKIIGSRSLDRAEEFFCDLSQNKK